MEGLHPPHRAASSQKYGVFSFATLSSEMSSLAWALLFVLQRCTIFLCNLVTATTVTQIQIELFELNLVSGVRLKCIPLYRNIAHELEGTGMKTKSI
jgi:hypothetical protein